jgi:thioredoxin-related protein
MDLIASYGVMGFPTFVLLEAGREVGRIRGAMPRRRFEAALDELLAGARA